jgi:hydrogenase/urease accessory protein HupE
VLVLVLVLVLEPAPALAHPLSFGLLEVREEASGRVTAELRFSGSEARPRGAGIVLPDACEQSGATSAPIEIGEVRRIVARCPGGLAGRSIGISRPEDAQVLLRLRLADGRELQATLDDARPRFRVPRPAEASGVLFDYVRLGVEHIATGVDHLLFVLGLLLLVTGGRRLVVAVTAFTAGHSVTLALAALGVVHVPAPPVEACIALSLVLVAFELTRGDERALARRAPALLAAGFGLLHGLGFASALTGAGFPAGQVPLALLGFNAGVELGQLAFIAVAVGAGFLLARSDRAIAWSRRALPYAIGAAGTFLCMERLAAFLLPWPP